MSRDIPYDKKLKCDNCGHDGAFDFMGDYYCGDCLKTCGQCGDVFVISGEEDKLCYECRLKRDIIYLFYADKYVKLDSWAVGFIGEILDVCEYDDIERLYKKYKKQVESWKNERDDKKDF